jgi:hypothetical protein
VHDWLPARAGVGRPEDRIFGRGITVTGTPQDGAVLEKTKDLLRFARSQGYRPDDLIQLIEQLQ